MHSVIQPKRDEVVSCSTESSTPTQSYALDILTSWASQNVTIEDPCMRESWSHHDLITFMIHVETASKKARQCISLIQIWKRSSLLSSSVNHLPDPRVSRNLVSLPNLTSISHLLPPCLDIPKGRLVSELEMVTDHLRDTLKETFIYNPCSSSSLNFGFHKRMKNLHWHACSPTTHFKYDQNCRERLK